MARVPLIDENTNPELAELVAKLRAGRRGELINVYRLLLHSPALAESWFGHSNAVRWKKSIGDLSRTGDRPHRARPRRRLRRQAARAGIDHARRDHRGRLHGAVHWRMATNFSESERAALAYADIMTRDVDVPDPSTMTSRGISTSVRSSN
jgi:hypothetical protein